MMDLRHLRYFVCVAEEAHFGRAAKRLGISQPPLSQQIRSLEMQLDAQLFERTSRRVALTEAGRMFLPEARATLAQAERAERTARMAQSGHIGHLALGFTSSGPFVPQVADALHQFRANFPQVELTLRELGRDEQVDAIARHYLDIGIVRSFEPPIVPEGLISAVLMEEEMFVAVRKDHRLNSADKSVTICDLEHEPLVLYSSAIGAGFNEYFFALCGQSGFRPNIVQEAGSLATLLGLVSAGFGATILAKSLTRLRIDNLVYLPFSDPLKSRLWLINRIDPSAACSAFRERLLAEA